MRLSRPACADQGPDDFIARNGADAFKALIDNAVAADPIAVIAHAASGSNRTEAVARVLGSLPVQAMLHEGGAVVVDQVAAAARVAGIGKRAVQQAASTFAERLARRAAVKDEAWKSKLRKMNNGDIAGTADNVLTILANDPAWKGVLGHNEFSERVVLRKPAPWDDDDTPASAYKTDQEVTDADDVRLVAWLGRHHKIKITTAMAHEAICVAAERHRFHPVREYLDALVWDGVPRIGAKDVTGWLARYVGVEDDSYSRVVGRWWLISAVARIMRPGCLVKTMLVLCGNQDARKSQVFFTLGGDWFMDDLRDIHSKDACQQLAGKWIAEFGEMAAWTKGDAETGKRFISTRSDNYRPAYGRRNRDFPRQCVFGGTTNVEEFIGDHTGGARFWPVTVGRIDIDALRQDRDQLWAEALALFKLGEKWWTDDDAEIADLREHQDACRRRDAWEEIIASALVGKTEATAKYILEEVLVIPTAQQNENTRPRVGRVLHALGWQRRQRRRPDGTREWFYARAVTSVTGVTGASPSPNGEDPEVDPALPRQMLKPTGDTGDTGDKPGKQAGNAVTSCTAAPIGTGDAGDGADAEEAPVRHVLEKFDI